MNNVPVCILLQQSWLTRSIQTTTAVIHNIGRNYSFNPVLSCNREYCNNGHIFLQRNLVYLQHNPLYPCIALVHHTATVQRPCSRPGFCSINEDIKTSFLCEHGIPHPIALLFAKFLSDDRNGIWIIFSLSRKNKKHGYFHIW